MTIADTAPTVDYLRKRLSALANTNQPKFNVTKTGQSREGRDILAVTLGSGPFAVSLTAGAHSDEPAGPLAALAIIETLLKTDAGKALLEKTNWTIFPHVNPDGAERNALWYEPVPSFLKYSDHAFRELPGEDVEFCYPEGTRPAGRPENQAVADFLRKRGPFHFHASLHGMGFAEGAWWLIAQESIKRTEELRPMLTELFLHNDLGQHDIERRGEKGFTRIERGFSTTPSCTAMRAFFLSQNDEKTASLFRPSSMEFVQSLGGDPVIMVSELPIFRIKGGGVLEDPPQEDTPFVRFREEYKRLKGRPESERSGELLALAERFDITAIPFSTQAETIHDAILKSVSFLLP